MPTGFPVPSSRVGPPPGAGKRPLIQRDLTTLVVVFPTAPNTSGPVVKPVANAPMFPNGASSGAAAGMLHEPASAVIRTAHGIGARHRRADDGTADDVLVVVLKFRNVTRIVVELVLTAITVALLPPKLCVPLDRSAKNDPGLTGTTVLSNVKSSADWSASIDTSVRSGRDVAPEPLIGRLLSSFVEPGSFNDTTAPARSPPRTALETDSLGTTAPKPFLQTSPLYVNVAKLLPSAARDQVSSRLADVARRVGEVKPVRPGVVGPELLIEEVGDRVRRRVRHHNSQVRTGRKPGRAVMGVRPGQRR